MWSRTRSCIVCSTGIFSTTGCLHLHGVSLCSLVVSQLPESLSQVRVATEFVIQRDRGPCRGQSLHVLQTVAVIGVLVGGDQFRNNRNCLAHLVEHAIPQFHSWVNLECLQAYWPDLVHPDAPHDEDL